MSFLQGLFGPPNIEKLKTKGNVKGLIKVLSYKDNSNARKAAAIALGEIGSELAVEPLIAVLKKDGERDVRQAAAEALDTLGWQPDKSEAGAFYWIEKRRWDKCVEIGAPTVEPLVAALKYLNQDMRQAVTEALDTLGWQPDKSEAGAFYWVGKRQWEKCVEIGAPAVEPLVRALRDEEKDVRREVGEVLCGLSEPEKGIVPVLIALGDDNPEIRFDALRSCNGAGLSDKLYSSPEFESRVENQMAMTVSSDDKITKARFWCGMGYLFSRNAKGWDKATTFYVRASELASGETPLAILWGYLEMVKSNNCYAKGNESQSREYHDSARKLLNTAINMDEISQDTGLMLGPSDPTPYYAFSNSHWLNPEELKRKYLRAIRLDQARLPIFANNHYGFGMKLAESSPTIATDAFRRAMIVAPYEYESGPVAIRPAGGAALSSWMTAKETVSSYRDDPEKMDKLWLPEKA